MRLKIKKIVNQSNKLNIEFLEHMGYYIPKFDFEGFDPDIFLKDQKWMKTEYVGMKHVRNLVIVDKKLKERNVRIIKNQLIKLNFPSNKLIL